MAGEAAADFFVAASDRHTRRRRGVLAGLLAPAFLVALGLLQPAHAQEEQAEEQEYVSIRIDVWSKRLRSVDPDGFGLKFRVALSTALFRYRTLDQFLDPETEHVNAVGVRPKLEFEIPTSINNVSFVPELEMAVNKSLDTRSNVFAGAAVAAWLYRHNGDDRDLQVKTSVKYATEFEDDGVNFDDYLELGLRINLKQITGFRIGERRLTVVPFGEFKHYADELEFETGSGALFDVTRQYELGFEFGTAPQKKIWGVTLPAIRISYAFGDDFRGINIRL